MGIIVISTVDGKEYIYNYDGITNSYSWNRPHENYITIYQKSHQVAIFNLNNIISLRTVEEK